MENIIVCAIVGMAALWAGFHFFGKRKARPCSTGCEGCSCPSKSQPLVTLKR